MKSGLKKMGVVLLSSALLLGACGDGEKTNSSGEDKTFKIGVTQIVEHPSLNAAYDGFKKALEDAGIEAEYDVQIAQGDASASKTIAANLVSSNVDLILRIQHQARSQL